MNYIVLDLEWNQGNPAKEPEVYGVPFEIVEIAGTEQDSLLHPRG